MRITALKETKAGRVALSVDGEYTASLDMLTVAEYGLRVNDEIKQETLDEILSVVSLRRAKSRAVNFLSYRGHSAAELRRKLLRTEIESDADAAVARMEELGLVDDTSFAEALVRELSEIKLYGRVKVKSELMKRGISPEITESALETLPDQLTLIERYLTGRDIPLRGSRADRDKLTRKLMTRGFEWDDIRSALAEYEIVE